MCLTRVLIFHGLICLLCLFATLFVFGLCWLCCLDVYDLWCLFGMIVLLRCLIEGL